LIVLDTGPLLASVDRHDPYHAVVSRLLKEVVAPVLVPSPVLVEASFLVGRRFGAHAEAALLRRASEGVLLVEDATRVDIGRAAELVEKYANLRIGMVDAVVVAMAERLGTSRVLTLDRRHFTVIRPAHCEALELLP
jgi:predicted nucleic acid-binding protein